MVSKTRPTILVALIAAHPVVRSGLEALLARHARISVILGASSIAEAIGLEVASPPDVVILDSGSLGGETRKIHRRFPMAKLIVFGSGDPQEEVEAARRGIRDYLSQSSPPEEIVRAVEAVHGGGMPPSPRLSQPHGAVAGEKEADKGRFSSLTQRERQVLILVAEGHTSRDIARLLRLSARTVESHREHVARKLGIHTVAGLTRFAVANGLVKAD